MTDFLFDHAFWILLIVLVLIFGGGIWVLFWGDKYLAKKAEKERNQWRLMDEHSEHIGVEAGRVEE